MPIYISCKEKIIIQLNKATGIQIDQQHSYISAFIIQNPSAHGNCQAILSVIIISFIVDSRHFQNLPGILKIPELILLFQYVIINGLSGISQLVHFAACSDQSYSSYLRLQRQKTHHDSAHT